MEEIEICAKCGKMVPLRALSERFVCPRCSSTATMVVPLKNYEKVVQGLQEGKEPFEEAVKNPGRDDSLKKKPIVEICSNCGKVADSSDYKGKDFVCSKCGCDVSVVLPKEMFDRLIKEGFGKKE